MSKIQKRVDNIIVLASNLMLKHPNNLVVKTCLEHFSILRNELSQPEPNREKIKSKSYGLIRAYDAMPEFQDIPFGKEMGKLISDLNKY